MLFALAGEWASGDDGRKAVRGEYRYLEGPELSSEVLEHMHRILTVVLLSKV